MDISKEKGANKFFDFEFYSSPRFDSQHVYLVLRWTVLALPDDSCLSLEEYEFSRASSNALKRPQTITSTRLN